MLACLVLAGTLAQAGFVPAQLRSGSPPPRQPPDVVVAGQVVLEVTVGDDGTVGHVHTLRDSRPYAELMRVAVSAWRFEPAMEDDRRVESRVLVAAVFRAPVLSPGPVPVLPPRDAESACTEIPYPVEIAEPPYPVMALGEEIVLVEVQVDTGGQVADAAVLEGGEPFADLALAAARGWHFDAACRQGRPVRAVAYLAFGFRQPVVGAPIR